MIKLTRIDGPPVYVAPEHIKMISSHLDDANVTTVSLGKGHCANVNESSEEVAKKVLEYKLLMESYKASSHLRDYKHCDGYEGAIRRLAGLEDTQ